MIPITRNAGRRYSSAVLESGENRRLRTRTVVRAGVDAGADVAVMARVLLPAEAWSRARVRGLAEYRRRSAEDQPPADGVPPGRRRAPPGGRCGRLLDAVRLVHGSAGVGCRLLRILVLLDDEVQRVVEVGPE